MVNMGHEHERSQPSVSGGEDRSLRCTNCNGAGEVPLHMGDDLYGMVEECSRCHGSGRIPASGVGEDRGGNDPGSWTVEEQYAVAAERDRLREDWDLVARITKRKLDENVQPLIAYVDGLPDDTTGEKRRLMGYLHSLHNGLMGMRDMANEALTGSASKEDRDV
jgi:hypothetical protein